MTLPIYKYIIDNDEQKIEFEAPLIDTVGGHLLFTNLGLPFVISQVDHDRLLVVGFTTTGEQNTRVW